MREKRGCHPMSVTSCEAWSSSMDLLDDEPIESL